MNVLLISPKMEKPNGGIAVWTNEYLSYCRQNGIQCALVNSAAIGIRAENGGAKRNFFDEIKRTKSIFLQLKKALKSDCFDVAHLNSSCGTFGIIRDYLTAKIIKRKCPSLKLLSHFHCDIPFQVRNAVGRFFLKKLVQLSDENLVLCKGSRRFLDDLCTAQSVLIPNFISEKDVLIGEKEISDQLHTFYYVGRIEKSKGMEELFESAKAFPEIRFELAGVISEEMKTVDLPKNIFLLGAVSHENVLAQMDGADAFVFPSHSEGFSIALLEAMARGLPCIATDVGANADMLENGGGIVIPASDVRALTDALKKILDAEKRRAMSRFCVEKVQNEYTRDQVMRRIFSLYSK